MIGGLIEQFKVLRERIIMIIIIIIVTISYVMTVIAITHTSDDNTSIVTINDKYDSHNDENNDDHTYNNAHSHNNDSNNDDTKDSKTTINAVATTNTA